jgi:hypothetical protein
VRNGERAPRRGARPQPPAAVRHRPIRRRGAPRSGPGRARSGQRATRAIPQRRSCHGDRAMNPIARAGRSTA